MFTGSTTPAVAIGDAVLATGRVSEFYPEALPATAHQSTTELTGATWTIESSGNAVPAAELLTPTTVPTGYVPDAGGATIEALPLQPAVYALDYYESREGMPLRVVRARVVDPTDGFNALWFTSKPAQNRAARGGTLYRSYANPNSGRLKIESLIPFAQRPFPKADVGDTLAGITEGFPEYTRFGGYVLEATALATSSTMTDTANMTRNSQVGTVFVPVSDQDRALEFYLDRLGFEKRADFPYGDGSRWVEVAPPGSAIAIALVPPSEGESAGGDEAHCAFATEEIEADHATLRARGVDVDAEIARTGKRRSGLVSIEATIKDPVPSQFFFRDTNGNRFLIVEPG